MSEFVAVFRIARRPDGGIAYEWRLSRDPDALEMTMWHSQLMVKAQAIGEAFRNSEIKSPPSGADGNGHEGHRAPLAVVGGG